jgi:hypothetical protein
MSGRVGANDGFVPSENLAVLVISIIWRFTRRRLRRQRRTRSSLRRSRSGSDHSRLDAVHSGLRKWVFELSKATVSGALLEAKPRETRDRSSSKSRDDPGVNLPLVPEKSRVPPKDPGAVLHRTVAPDARTSRSGSVHTVCE